MVRNSEKPVISKTSSTASGTFLSFIAPFVPHMDFCALRRTRRPAEEMYSISRKSSINSLAPESTSARVVSSSGAVVVSRQPERVSVVVSPQNLLNAEAHGENSLLLFLCVMPETVRNGAALSSRPVPDLALLPSDKPPQRAGYRGAPFLRTDPPATYRKSG